MKKPTKAEIAAALGISAPAFSRYVRNGCPTFSIDAARRWQSQNVDPSQRLLRDAGRASPAAQRAGARDAQPTTALQIELLTRLGELAEHDFTSYAERLRRAMRELPAALREQVELPELVWRQLFDQARLPVIEREFSGASDDEPALPDDAFGALLWDLASGARVFR